MKPARCPNCRTHLDDELIAADMATAEFQRRLYQLDIRLHVAVVPYIGLFRPDKADLQAHVALARLDEVLALSNDHPRLALALTQTTEQIRAKWREQGRRKLGGHNYLAKVLEGTPSPAVVGAGLHPVRSAPAGPTSKHAQAMAALDD